MNLLATPTSNEVARVIPVCHQIQDEANSQLLSKTQSTKFVRPRPPPLLTLQPASSLRADSSAFFSSSEVIHETEEEGGSSTNSSNRDGRLTPMSLFDNPHSPSGSIGNRSSLSYFSYLGENFVRSSASSPVMNIGSGVILSCASSSFQGSIPSATANFPKVFFPDDETRTNQIIDYCSCMCCVKALFYHCGKGSEEKVAEEENICSCDEPGVACMKRWGILSLLTCCMPLLLFYAPLKGIQKVTQKLKRRFRKTTVH